MNVSFYNLARIAAGLIFIGLTLPAVTWAHYDDDFERIFIFGDSLSDAGNVFALTGETAQPPYDVVPSRPYGFRGFQFSNGKTWAQRFARRMGLRRSGRASSFAPGKNGNYAFGGARARSDSPSQVPSSRQQLNLYLADFGSADDENLYVIQFGGNDVRDALNELLTNPGPPENPLANALPIIQAAVTEEVDMILRLYRHGARDFLVANVPNLGLTPAVRLAGPEAVFAANLLVGGYNEGLDAALHKLRHLKGIRINRLDFFGILNDIAADPRSFRIRNAESACLTFFTKIDPVCRRPGKYLFWDGIHPTAKVHRIVARQAVEIYD